METCVGRFFIRVLPWPGGCWDVSCRREKLQSAVCYQDLTWVPCESNMFAEIELDDRQSDTVCLCKHDNHEAFIEKDRQK